MYTNKGAYCDNDTFNQFFDAKKCYEKFIRFTNYFKNFTETRYYSRLLDLDTNEYIEDSIMINGEVRTYTTFDAEKFEKKTPIISTFVWDIENRCYQPKRQLNIKIDYMTLYDYCKKDIDNFADFFLRHGKQGHLVQGYWS